MDHTPVTGSQRDFPDMSFSQKNYLKRSFLRKQATEAPEHYPEATMSSSKSILHFKKSSALIEGNVKVDSGILHGYLGFFGPPAQIVDPSAHTAGDRLIYLVSASTAPEPVSLQPHVV